MKMPIRNENGCVWIEGRLTERGIALLSLGESDAAKGRLLVRLDEDGQVLPGDAIPASLDLIPVSDQVLVDLEPEWDRP